MAPKKHAQCFKFDTDNHNIRKCVKEGHRVFLILRGAPGSGKTTLAKSFVDIAVSEELKSALICAQTVMASQIAKKVREAIRNDVPLIIVDDEHVDRLTIKTLALIATTESYECFVAEPDTLWKYNAQICKEKTQRSDTIDMISKKIATIQAATLRWDHIVAGGESNLEVYNFYDNPSSSDSYIAPKISSLTVSQEFSLAPTPKMTSTRSCGTTVCMEAIIHEMADIDDEFPHCGFFLGEEKTVKAKDMTNISMVERCEETEDVRFSATGERSVHPWPPLVKGTSDDVAFSLLRCTFGEIDLAVLRHNLQIFGYEIAFEIFKILEGTSENDLLPSDDRFLFEELEQIESYTIPNIEDELEARQSEREMLQFHEDEEADTGNDAQIAYLVFLELNGSDELSQNQDDFNISRLSRAFPDCPDVKQVYEAGMKDYETVREMLRAMEYQEFPLEPIVPQKSSTTYSGTVASSSPVRSAKPMKTKNNDNHFLKKQPNRKSHQPLKEVQREALEMRNNIGKNVSNQASLVAKQFSYSATSESATRRREQLAIEIGRIDQKIRCAHNNPWNLDLHYMSVDGAIELVLEAIEAVEYLIKYSPEKFPRRITVVTGSGNNSKDGAKIKPQVISMLKSRRISFGMLNDGCIEVKL
ncbi:Protein CBG17965 [Caenorhabditis briggsae]|uniref:Protein CBG17965 n=2 Tax=Caenorhabditis briggsae TaxID=6238 RepID=A8XSP4_CAEBR|nr:Protein CBG17965 [Caenorhabditis briggsae]ULU00853.1 hypothetical protein L3Y34_001341 [Caenorhabditis briggsae]CAP35496.1 Protein CBG17965 [Caenorhabditis briggsae]